MCRRPSEQDATAAEHGRISPEEGRKKRVEGLDNARAGTASATISAPTGGP